MKRTTTFLWLLLGGVLLLLPACAPDVPLSAVTPIALESAAVRSTEYIATPAPTPSPLPGGIGAPPPEHLLPTPVLEELPQGASLAQVRATDVAWQITPASPYTLTTRAPHVLRFDEFFLNYDPYSYEAPTLSDKLMALDGQRVVMEGYMAPPLKLGLDWFMLTRIPVGACPFCSGAADWTPDIVLIYVEGEEYPYTYQPLRVEGELHIGPAIDPETGMVSLVRIYATRQTVATIGY